MLTLAAVAAVTVCWCKALEKAKEAGRLEKTLRQTRERGVTTGNSASPADQPNFDLTYAVSQPTLFTCRDLIISSPADQPNFDLTYAVSQPTHIYMS